VWSWARRDGKGVSRVLKSCGGENKKHDEGGKERGIGLIGSEKKPRRQRHGEEKAKRSGNGRKRGKTDCCIERSPRSNKTDLKKSMGGGETKMNDESIRNPKVYGKSHVKKGTGVIDQVG